METTRKAERKWLSIDDVAGELGVSRTPIYQEVIEGRLKAKRIGKKPTIRIHRGDFEDWLSRSDYA